MPKKKEQPEKETKEEQKAQDVKPSDITKPDSDTNEASQPKKKEKTVRAAIAHIASSSNNTAVHITDLAGNTISRVSGGMVTKHARLRSNPTNAMFIAKRAGERAKDLGVTALYIRMRGPTGGTGTGPGAHAAVKTLDKEGFTILNVLDVTKVPRGGPKKKGGRRGRRV